MFFYGKVRTILFLVSLKNCCTEVLPSGTAICFWIYLSKRNFRNEEVEAPSIIISNRDYQRSFFFEFSCCSLQLCCILKHLMGIPNKLLVGKNDIYAMNINEILNKNITFQQIITITQNFGTQWYLYLSTSILSTMIVNERTNTVFS